MEMVNLSRYRIKTYSVSIVSEAPAQSQEYAGRAVRSSEDTYRLGLGLFQSLSLDRDREHFVLLCLNNKNRLEGFKVISTGSLTSALVHPREVYHAAITLRAAAVVFIHNHPSGEPMPSPEDLEITRRLKEVGEVLGVRVLDHVIIGYDRYYSFSDRGTL